MPWRCSSPRRQQLHELRRRQGQAVRAVTPEGYVIGDVILFYLAENDSASSAARRRSNWVNSTPRPPDGDVEVERDERTALRSDGTVSTIASSCRARTRWRSSRRRWAIPRGPQVLQHGAHQIAGEEVIALRHGMAGQPGTSCSGRGKTTPPCTARWSSAGKNDGLTLVGGRAYSSNTLESGWLPSPLPAFYTGEADDQGLPPVAAGGTATPARPRSAAATCPTDLEGYYLTPWDIGYGHIVKFDHEFVGREALERMATRAPDQGHPGARRRRRAARDDVPGSDRAKYMEFPSAVYAMHPFDEVRSTARPSAFRPGSATRQRRRDADPGDDRSGTSSPARK